MRKRKSAVQVFVNRAVILFAVLVFAGLFSAASAAQVKAGTVDTTKTSVNSSTYWLRRDSHDDPVGDEGYAAWGRSYWSTYAYFSSIGSTWDSHEARKGPFGYGIDDEDNYPTAATETSCSRRTFLHLRWHRASARRAGWCSPCRSRFWFRSYFFEIFRLRCK